MIEGIDKNNVIEGIDKIPLSASLVSSKRKPKKRIFDKYVHVRRN